MNFSNSEKKLSEADKVILVKKMTGEIFLHNAKKAVVVQLGQDIFSSKNLLTKPSYSTPFTAKTSQVSKTGASASTIGGDIFNKTNLLGMKQSKVTNQYFLELDYKDFEQRPWRVLDDQNFVLRIEGNFSNQGQVEGKIDGHFSL